MITRAAFAIAAAIIFAGSQLATASAATTPAPLCGLTGRAVQEASGGTFVYTRANAFDTSGQRFCVSPNAGPGFTVTTNLRYTGLWQAYPFTGLGCAYSLCSRNTDLPKRVSALPHAANVSFSWRGVNAAGTHDTALDIWFDKKGQITQQDNGAELMIWLGTPRGYTGGYKVRIAHRTYWFYAWRAHNGSKSWWYLQFRTTKTVMGVKQLWLRPFLRFLEHTRLRVRSGSRATALAMQPAWYLTSIHAGFELVSGGKGLTVRWFNAHV